MNLRELRLPLVALAVVVILGLLFGGRWLYFSQALDRPLEEAVAAVPGVTEVSAQRDGDLLRVRVRAGEVDRLEDLVASLSHRIAALERGREVVLEIGDSRDEDLREVYYDLHFAIQEAIATGRYGALQEQVETLSGTLGGPRGRVFIAPSYVFVQLHHGGSSLYEIIPREREPGVPGASAKDLIRVVSSTVTDG